MRKSYACLGDLTYKQAEMMIRLTAKYVKSIASFLFIITSNFCARILYI